MMSVIQDMMQEQGRACDMNFSDFSLFDEAKNISEDSSLSSLQFTTSSDEEERKEEIEENEDQCDGKESEGEV